jgi:hypothetical protein
MPQNDAKLLMALLNDFEKLSNAAISVENDDLANSYINQCFKCVQLTMYIRTYDAKVARTSMLNSIKFIVRYRKGYFNVR